MLLYGIKRVSNFTQKVNEKLKMFKVTVLENYIKIEATIFLQFIF